MNEKAIFNISYGLYVLTAKKDGKDNGCIVNTFAQVTSTPNRVSVTVNKQNYTHDLIKETGDFAVSILSTDVPFDIFKHFGFQSGRDVDKFADFEQVSRGTNGILHLTEYANAFVEAKVIQEIDLGTHTMFIADVTDCDVLSETESITYAYYHKHTKPQPKKEEGEKKGWRCKICGYVYEGDPLPADFICPLCKHGAADFEKI